MGGGGSRAELKSIGTREVTFRHDLVLELGQRVTDKSEQIDHVGLFHHIGSGERLVP